MVWQALWQALILADEEGIKRHSASMNAGDAYPLFAAMLTTRPWDQITRKSADHLYIPGTEEVCGFSLLLFYGSAFQARDDATWSTGRFAPSVL